MLVLFKNDLLVLLNAVSEDKRIVFKPDLGLLVDYVSNVLLQGQVEAFKDMQNV